MTSCLYLVALLATLFGAQFMTSYYDKKLYNFGPKSLSFLIGQTTLTTSLKFSAFDTTSSFFLAGALLRAPSTSIAPKYAVDFVTPSAFERKNLTF